MSLTTLLRTHRPALPAVLLLLLAALPATAADFTLLYNTGDTALRGDNFASHNQNIVWTTGGLFRSGDFQNDSNGSDNVVVQRSTDGGVTWSLLFDTGIHRENLKPPTIEADPAGNVYIVYPNSGGTRFVKFSASNNYSSQVTNNLTTAATSGSKFASAYDAGQDRLYHGTQYGRLLTYNTSGSVTANKHLITDGGDSRPSYPHVMVDEFGVIHYAMTVADQGDDVPYTDIRYMKSLDGGTTWRAMDNTEVSEPAAAAGSSGATLINRASEHDYASWLSNMHVKDGKVHFTYQTRNPWDPAGAGNPPSISPYMSYIRYDEATGDREIDRNELKGSSLWIKSEAASFASDTSNSTGALYVVGEKYDGNRLRALVSYDNGQTWQGYAESNWYSDIANPSLARSVTPDGKVIGGVALSNPWATVNYLELPTVQPTTTIAYWDGEDEFSAWNTSDNWVGNVAPSFDNKLAVAIGSGSSTAKFDTMRINDNRTVRALIFGTYADAAVNLGLKDSNGQSRTLTFESNVAGGSAEINVHHDATGNIDLGGGDALGDIVLNDPLRVKHDGQGTLSISRPISGAHGITKSGDGLFRLRGSSEYQGETVILGGRLLLGGDDSPSATRQLPVGTVVTVAQGAELWVNGLGGAADNNEIIGGLQGQGVVTIGNGSTIARLTIDNTDDYTFDGTITGSDQLLIIKDGPGTQTFTGDNTYSGGTTVRQGTLRIAGSGKISNDAFVDADGTLIFDSSAFNHPNAWSGTLTGSGLVQAVNTRTNLNGNNGAFAGTVQNVSGNRLDLSPSASSANARFIVDGTLTTGTTGGIINLGELSGSGSLGVGGGATGVTFVVGAKGTDSTFAGSISSGNTGTGVTKTGGGTLTLTGANSYPGATTINDGTLLVNGSLGNTAVAVNAGARLGGTGSIAGGVNVGSGGTLAPGASIESLSTGALALGDGSTFEWEYDSQNLLADLLEVDGELDLSGEVTLELQDLAATTEPIDPGTKFTLISYSGTWNNGTFADHADDSVFTHEGHLWQIDYDDTTAGVNGGSYGSYVTLTAVPEPSAAVLALLALLSLLGRRRRPS